MERTTTGSGRLTLLSLHTPSSRLVARLEDPDERRRPSSPSPSPFYSVCWLARGSGILRIDFEDYQLQPNHLYFVAPGQVVTWEVERPLSGWELSFSVGFLEGGMADQRLLRSLSFFHELDRRQELIPSPAKG